MTDYDNALFRQGLLHYKAREIDLARKYFERALGSADDNLTRVAACDYLSRLAENPVEKRRYLEQILALDPVNPEARREIAILDGRLAPEDIINPDEIPASPPGDIEVQADRFACPRCGGRMVYSSDGRSLVCEFCSRRQDLVGELAEENDFIVAMASRKGHQTAASTQVFYCQGCGAGFILGAREISTTCTWCGSLFVLRQDGTLPAPDALLPFALDKAVVQARVQEWVSEHSLQIIKGLPAPRPLYLPVWCFNILGSTPWSGHEDRDGQGAEVSGEEVVYLEDRPVPGIREHARLFSPLIAGFKFSSAVRYDPRYLAGWSAQVPDVALSDAALEARRMAVEHVRRLLRSRHGEIHDLRYGTSNLSVDRYRLVLVPVWLLELISASSSLQLMVDGVAAAVHSDPAVR